MVSKYYRFSSYILQGVCLLFLAVYTTAHGYVQPYRDLLTNLLEIAVNVNFLILLIMNTTHYFNDDLFIFPRHDDHHTEECGDIHNSIAHVSWIFMPVYYLPLIGACVIATVLAVVFLRLILMFYLHGNILFVHFCLSLTATKQSHTYSLPTNHL